MMEVIETGGSVLYNGQTITKKAHLPTEAELAKGDSDLEARAKANLERQIAEAKAQLEMLAEEPVEAEASAEVEASAEEPAEEKAAPAKKAKSKAKSES